MHDFYYAENNIEKIADITKIMVNGNWIGFTE